MAAALLGPVWAAAAFAQTSNQLIITQTGNVLVPSTSVNDIYAYGSCGAGGASSHLNPAHAGGGSGCGAFVHRHNVTLTAGYIIAQVSQGGDSLATSLKDSAGVTTIISADYGRSALGRTGGAGGSCAASTGDDCQAGGSGADGLLLGTNAGMPGSTGGSLATLSGAGFNGQQPYQPGLPQTPYIPVAGPGCGSIVGGQATTFGAATSTPGAGIFGNGQGASATAMAAAMQSSHCAGGPAGYPASGYLNALDGSYENLYTNGTLSIGPKSPGGASAAIAVTPGASGLGTPGNGAGGAVNASREQDGGHATPGFIVIVYSTIGAIAAGHATLTGLQSNLGEPVVFPHPDAVSCPRTRVLRPDETHTITIGYQTSFGGMIGCVTPQGYGSGVDGTNIVIQGGGRAWTGSTRDNLHNGDWNPTWDAAGVDCGVPGVIETSGQTDSVREYAVPLFMNSNNFVFPETGRFATTRPRNIPMKISTRFPNRHRPAAT